jgi:ABC-type polysaccharide/polyol phosphate transport system ATPase subunit
MSIIELAQVSKRFRLQPDRPRSLQELALGMLGRRAQVGRAQDFWALRDVSFCVSAGETLGLIGSNGSGKSTCLKLLARILEPTSGTIRVEGRVSALLELGAGFHPELTGRENVFLSGSVLGLKRREMARRLDDIVAFAELERFIDIPVKFYSSGMYVRLAFALAINVQPDILLVDEVLAVGDKAFQDKCLERINELKGSGITIVLVSHDLSMIRNLCSRAIWLDDGLLCESGITHAVAERYLQHVREQEEAAAYQQRDKKRLAEQCAPETPSAAQEASAGAVPAESQATCEAAVEGDPIARQRGRWGTREVEIVDVLFLDAEGKERLLLATGEAATIVLRYCARQRIENPVFGVAIHRNDGLHMNGTNTHINQYHIPSIEGEGEVRYAIRALPLLEGTYYLSVAVHDESETRTYDYQNLAHRFSVYADKVVERVGTVYIPAGWQHVSGSAPAREEARP